MNTQIPASFDASPFDVTLAFADTVLQENQRWSTWPATMPTERGPLPRPDWVVTSAAAVDTELGILKTGKEADVFLIERAVPDDGREHPDPLGQIDERHDVGRPPSHRRVPGRGHGGAGVHGAGAGRRAEREAIAEARRARLPREVDGSVAVVAPLEHELELPGGVPEAHGGVGDRRLEPIGRALGGRDDEGLAHAVASVPSRIVDIAESTPGDENRFLLLFTASGYTAADGIYTLRRSGAPQVTLFLSAIGPRGMTRAMQAVVSRTA